MRRGSVFFVLAFLSMPAFSQQLAEDPIQPLDSVVVDSLVTAFGAWACGTAPSETSERSRTADIPDIDTPFEKVRR